MATLYPMSRLTKSLVEEKELKQREITRVMGMFEWASQGAWFITAFITFLWIAASCTFLSKISFLPHINTSILFVYFFLFCLSEVQVSFLISVFFSNSKLAAIFAPVFLFMTVLPRFAFLNTNANEVAQSKYFACLLPATAFSFGADIIASYESSALGVQYSNWTDGTFNFLGVLGFLLLDIFIYGGLAW